MASKYKFNCIPYQVQRDIKLLDFNFIYEDYVDSFVNTKDLEYMSGVFITREIMKNGLGSTGRVLSQKEFLARSNAAKKFLHRNYKLKKIYSHGIKEFVDPLLKSLAKREEKNVAGIIATVIYLRDYSEFEHEISAYIDFRYRLCTQNWTDIFSGKVKIKPCAQDLSYYNWKNHDIFRNDSPNFQVLTGEIAGNLLVRCLHDKRTFKIDTEGKRLNVRRTEIPTKMYLQAVLYDHVIEKMIDLRKQII